MAQENGQGGKMDGAVKVTAIMEALCSSRAPLTIRDVEEITGIPKSTAHRFLLSLEEQQWAFRDPLTEGYRPGIRFFLLSGASSFYDELIRTADPEMRELMKTTGNTAILSVTEGTSGLCIHSVEPPASVKFTAHRGMAIPLHAGATGKVLLAHCAPEIRARVLASSLRPPRGDGLVDRTELEKELERIREQGFAFSREEWMPHAGDISVPLFDGRGVFVAQMGVAGLADSIFRDFDGTLRLLKEAVRSVERKMDTHIFGGGNHVSGE